MSQQHLTDEQLLLACDQEAGGASELHLSRCESCRQRMEEIRATEAAYRALHASVRKGMPAPPRAWKPMPVGFPAQTQRRRLSAIPVLPWVAAIAALVLIGVALREGRDAAVPAVGDLLARAEGAEQPWAPTRRIALKSRKRGVLVRPAVYVRTVEQHPLQGLFRRADYSWEDPLSVRSYNAWRQKLKRKKDSVTRSRHPRTAEPIYVVKTETSASELTEATLSLREQDLQPLSGTLRFEGDEVIEMEEFAGSAPSSAPTPAASAPAPVPPRTAPVLPISPMLELQVLVALHNIGADLGEPVQLTREGDQLLVSATGLSPSRRAQIEKALTSFAQVTVRFEAPEAAPPGATRRPELPPRSGGGRVQAFVEEHLQGRAPFEQYVNDALDASDAALSRAHALAALGERFPASLEPQLPAEGRELLEALRRDHNRALREQITRIVGLLQEGFGILPAPGANAGAPDWQGRARALRVAAQEFDMRLTGMLTGVRPLDVAALEAAFQQMRAEAP